MEKLEVDSKSGSDEEFYDCIGKLLPNEKKTVSSLKKMCVISLFINKKKISKGKKVTLIQGMTKINFYDYLLLGHTQTANNSIYITHFHHKSNE